MSDARTLLKGVFDFLEKFNEIRNPTILRVDQHEEHWWWSEIPNSHYVAVADFSDVAEDDRGSEDEDDAILTVRRPDLEEPPPPPGDLERWVVAPDWKIPTREASWVNTLEDPDDGLVRLSPEDESRLQQWKLARDEWADRVRKDFLAGRLFDWLWGVHATLDREGEQYELVLGDGILSWSSDGKTAQHPLLIQRLQIEFDSSLPAFVVREADRPPELYTALLSALSVDANAVRAVREDLAESRAHPLGSENTDSFLQRTAGRIHSDGRFLGFREPPTPVDYPQISRGPVLFLRARTLGFQTVIEAILEDLKNGGEIPESLEALVGVHQRVGTEEQPSDPFELGDETADVYLTKEANREQLEIARRLARYGAVLVQGPPGTGKTHTIANLIGHLLAQGKSVLVTSHTTKALRVLRDKVVPELQPLCVSVLDGDAESNQQLQQSVTEISRRLSSASEDQLQREAEQYRRERVETLREIQETRQRLLEAVQGEYTPIVLDGQEFLPLKAAEIVREGSGKHSWIPGRVLAGAPLPLSPAQVQRLYKLNGELSKRDEEYLSAQLPDPSELPPPELFRRELEKRKQLEPLGNNHRELWKPTASRAQTELQEFARQAREAYAPLRDAPAWYLAAFEDGLAGGEEKEPWLLLLADLKRLEESLRQRRHAQRTFAATLGSLDPLEVAPVIDEILARLRSGKGLRRFGLLTPGSWKTVLSQASVLGKPPASVDDFETLRRLVVPHIELNAVRPRWEVLLGPYGEALELDETAVGKLVERLEDALENRPQLIRATEDRGDALGFAIDAFFPDPDAGDYWSQVAAKVEGELEAVVGSEIARIELAQLGLQQQRLNERLSTYTGYSDPNHPVGSLGTALQAQDPDAYARAYEQLRSLVVQRSMATERNDLLVRLSEAAPDWAEAIRLRQPPHDWTEPPGDPQEAWTHAQLTRALDERRAQDPSELVTQIQRLRARLREQTAQLVDRLAWASLAKNTDHNARQALQSYVQLVRKIGRNRGRRAPRLRAAAREQMSQARSAVPVWIAPLARVAETFDPRSRRFDVVIIDEASQADVLGLIAWYLGKSIIVVGDDQQVTPDAVGIEADKMISLIDTYLHGTPTKNHFDANASVYELASVAFRGVVRLREHFRCVPSIISFSNRLCYGGDIVPLREEATAAVGPAVVPYRVDVPPAPDGGGGVNEAEARAVAALLLACSEQPEYDGLTFGVIALRGNHQSALIERLLRSALSPLEFQERSILCGSPPHFQGDERDVVFLSVVYGPPESPPHRLLGDPGERFKKRFNVATSRAKDQLWVVHSLDRATHLQTGDLRAELLSWAANPDATELRKADAAQKSDSEFEFAVAKRLIDAGYRIKQQYPVGGFRIDIVVEGTASRLAVECDGDQFHSSPEQIREDLDRQALLERMGWEFHRIRGSDFYRDPDAAMARLFRRLERQGIEPLGAEQELVNESRWEELLERVKARAAEILQEWARSDGGEGYAAGVADALTDESTRGLEEKQGQRADNPDDGATSRLRTVSREFPGFAPPLSGDPPVG